VQGFAAFADALMMNSSLRRLSLDDNDALDQEGGAALARIVAIFAMNSDDRLFQTLRHNGGTKIVKELDFLDEDLGEIFDRESVRRLGEALCGNTVVTDLTIPFCNGWTRHDVDNALRPLLRYIGEGRTLIRITYDLILHNLRTDAFVLEFFLAAVAMRPTVTDFKLTLDVGWLADADNLRVFGSLMRNKEHYSFLKNVSVTNVPPFVNENLNNVLDRNQFVEALRDNKSIECFSLDVEKPYPRLLRSLKRSAIGQTALRVFSLEVKDTPTFLLFMETLPALVQVRDRPDIEMRSCNWLMEPTAVRVAYSFYEKWVSATIQAEGIRCCTGSSRATAVVLSPQRGGAKTNGCGQGAQSTYTRNRTRCWKCPASC